MHKNESKKKETKNNNGGNNEIEIIDMFVVDNNKFVESDQEINSQRNDNEIQSNINFNNM